VIETENIPAYFDELEKIMPETLNHIKSCSKSMTLERVKKEPDFRQSYGPFLTK
jgi:septation ring formation regulator EzrA